MTVIATSEGILSPDANACVLYCCVWGNTTRSLLICVPVHFVLGPTFSSERSRRCGGGGGCGARAAAAAGAMAAAGEPWATVAAVAPSGSSLMGTQPSSRRCAAAATRASRATRASFRMDGGGGGGRSWMEANRLAVRRSFAARALSLAAPPTRPGTRVLHSSTFRLNVSTFCGIGGHLGVIQGVFRM
jgi:hypothetical protein